MPQSAPAPIIDASTPLPKPANGLRQSTSIMFSTKRASILTTRVLSGAGCGPLEELSERDAVADTTPTGAMRRLRGADGNRAALGAPAMMTASRTTERSTMDEAGTDHEPTLRDVMKLLGRLEYDRASRAPPNDQTPHKSAASMLDQLALMERDCKRRETGLKGLMEEVRGRGQL